MNREKRITRKMRREARSDAPLRLHFRAPNLEITITPSELPPGKSVEWMLSAIFNTLGNLK